MMVRLLLIVSVVTITFIDLAFSSASAQENLEPSLECARKIKVENPVYSTSKRIRASHIFICVADDNKRAGVHFIAASTAKEHSFPTADNAPWFTLDLRDSFGGSVWQGHIAIASVGTCGGYQTHFVPGPSVDWREVKVAIPSMGGDKPAKCGGGSWEERLGDLILQECQERYGTRDARQCAKSALSNMSK